MESSWNKYKRIKKTPNVFLAMSAALWGVLLMNCKNTVKKLKRTCTNSSEWKQPPGERQQVVQYFWAHHNEAKCLKLTDSLVLAVTLHQEWPFQRNKTH